MLVNQQCRPKSISLDEDGAFPNNPRLPLLVYKGAVEAGKGDSAADLESLFQSHNWLGTWQNGVYPFHHYHSNAHEALGCFAGSATVQFGGPNGPKLELGAGDVAVLPAGTSHKRINASDDFLIVGGYPEGTDYDMCRGEENERPEADRRIANTPVPTTDPVFGDEGGLLDHWTA